MIRIVFLDRDTLSPETVVRAPSCRMNGGPCPHRPA